MTDKPRDCPKCENAVIGAQDYERLGVSLISCGHCGRNFGPAPRTDDGPTKIKADPVGLAALVLSGVPKGTDDGEGDRIDEIRAKLDDPDSVYLGEYVAALRARLHEAEERASEAQARFVEADNEGAKAELALRAAERERDARQEESTGEGSSHTPKEEA